MKIIILVTLITMGIHGILCKSKNNLEVSHDVMDYILDCRGSSPSGRSNSPQVPFYETSVEPNSGVLTQSVSLIDISHLRESLKATVKDQASLDHIINEVTEGLTRGPPPYTNSGECPPDKKVVVTIPPLDMDELNEKLSMVLQVNNYQLLENFNVLLSYRLTNFYKDIDKLVRQRTNKVSQKIEELIVRLEDNGVINSIPNGFHKEVTSEEESAFVQPISSAEVATAEVVEMISEKPVVDVLVSTSKDFQIDHVDDGVVDEGVETTSEDAISMSEVIVSTSEDVESNHADDGVVDEGVEITSEDSINMSDGVVSTSEDVESDHADDGVVDEGVEITSEDAISMRQVIVSTNEDVEFDHAVDGIVDEGVEITSEDSINMSDRIVSTSEDVEPDHADDGVVDEGVEITSEDSINMSEGVVSTSENVEAVIEDHIIPDENEETIHEDFDDMSQDLVTGAENNETSVVNVEGSNVSNLVIEHLNQSIETTSDNIEKATIEVTEPLVESVTESLSAELLDSYEDLSNESFTRNDLEETKLTLDDIPDRTNIFKNPLAELGVNNVAQPNPQPTTNNVNNDFPNREPESEVDSPNVRKNLYIQQLTSLGVPIEYFSEKLPPHLQFARPIEPLNVVPVNVDPVNVDPVNVDPVNVDPVNVDPVLETESTTIINKNIETENTENYNEALDLLFVNPEEETIEDRKNFEDISSSLDDKDDLPYAAIPDYVMENVQAIYRGPVMESLNRKTHNKKSQLFRRFFVRRRESIKNRNIEN